MYFLSHSHHGFSPVSIIIKGFDAARRGVTDMRVTHPPATHEAAL